MPFRLGTLDDDTQDQQKPVARDPFEEMDKIVFGISTPKPLTTTSPLSSGKKTIRGYKKLGATEMVYDWPDGTTRAYPPPGYEVDPKDEAAESKKIDLFADMDKIVFGTESPSETPPQVAQEAPVPAQVTAPKPRPLSPWSQATGENVPPAPAPPPSIMPKVLHPLSVPDAAFGVGDARLTAPPPPARPAMFEASQLTAGDSNEAEFQSWYATIAQKQGLNPNPDDPQHHYDYRAAFRAGAMPDATGHWPSVFKDDQHPNLIVDGVNTKTGQRVAPSSAPATSRPIPYPQPDRTAFSDLLKSFESSKSDPTAKVQALTYEFAALADTQKAFDKRVAAWEAAGKPEAGFDDLNYEQQSLKARRDALNAQVDPLNAHLGELNATASRLNKLAARAQQADQARLAEADAAQFRPETPSYPTGPGAIPPPTAEDHPLVSAAKGVIGLATQAGLRAAKAGPSGGPFAPLAGYETEGALKVVQGIRHAAVAAFTPPSQRAGPAKEPTLEEIQAQVNSDVPPTPLSDDTLKGLSGAIEGVFHMAGPFVALAMATTPVATAIALGRAMVAGVAASAAVKTAGGSDEQARFAGDLASLAAGGKGAEDVLKATAKSAARAAGTIVEPAVAAAKAAGRPLVLAAKLSNPAYGVGDIPGARGAPYADSATGRVTESPNTRVDILANLEAAIEAAKAPDATPETAAQLPRLETALRQEQGFAAADAARAEHEAAVKAGDPIAILDEKMGVAPPPAAQPQATFSHFDHPDWGGAPMYNVTAPGHPLDKSTVSAETLTEAGIPISDTPKKPDAYDQYSADFDAETAPVPTPPVRVPTPPPVGTAKENEAASAPVPSAAEGAESLGTSAAPAGETPAPAPPAAMIRMYHGGANEDLNHATWFTSDRKYAEAYAEKAGGHVSYVDIPEDHPAIAPDYPEQSIAKGFHQNVELPAEIARLRTPLTPEAVETPKAPESRPATPQVAAADTGGFVKWDDAKLQDAYDHLAKQTILNTVERQTRDNFKRELDKRAAEKKQSKEAWGKESHDDLVAAATAGNAEAITEAKRRIEDLKKTIPAKGPIAESRRNLIRELETAIGIKPASATEARDKELASAKVGDQRDFNKIPIGSTVTIRAHGGDVTGTVVAGEGGAHRVQLEGRDQIVHRGLATITALPQAPQTKPEEPAQPPTTPKPEPATGQSFMAEMQSSEGDWNANKLRFATEKEARAYGRDLFSRWMGAKAYRVVASNDPVSHAWNSETGLSEKPAALKPVAEMTREELTAEWNRDLIPARNGQPITEDARRRRIAVGRELASRPVTAPSSKPAEPVKAETPERDIHGFYPGDRVVIDKTTLPEGHVSIGTLERAEGDDAVRVLFNDGTSLTVPVVDIQGVVASQTPEQRAEALTAARAKQTAPKAPTSKPAEPVKAEQSAPTKAATMTPAERRAAVRAALAAEDKGEETTPTPPAKPTPRRPEDVREETYTEGLRDLKASGVAYGPGGLKVRIVPRRDGLYELEITEKGQRRFDGKLTLDDAAEYGATTLANLAVSPTKAPVTPQVPVRASTPKTEAFTAGGVDFVRQPLINQATKDAAAQAARDEKKRALIAKLKAGDDDHEPQLARAGNGRIKAGIGDEGAAARIMASSLYSGNITEVATKELLQNAFDAIRSLGEAGLVTLRFSGFSEPEKWVEVEDNGPGMTRQEVESVFTDLFDSGKRASPAASGGFGIAKASFLLGGTKVDVETIAAGQRLTFTATPHELTTTGVDLHASKAPQSVQTGTRVRTYLPANASAFEALSFVESLAKYSSALPGMFLAYTGDTKVASSSPFSRTATFRAYATYDASIPGADIVIRTAPKAAEPSKGKLTRVLNNGVYQFDGHIGTTDPDGDEILGPSLALPETIIVDVKATVPEGDPSYPFTANREQLRVEFESALRRVLYREVVAERRAERTDLLQRTYDQMPTVQIGALNIPVLDSGKRLRRHELEDLFADPDMQHIAAEALDILDIVLTKGLGDERAQIEAVGFLLHENIYGVFVTNPSSVGSRAARRATILLNLFKHPVENASPDYVAAAVYHTIVHEAAHWLASGHNETFTIALGKLIARVGARVEVTSLMRLMMAYGDPNNDSQLRPGIADALQLYSASRGRPLVEVDALSGTGEHSQGSQNPPGGEGRPAGALHEDQGRTTPQRDLTDDELDAMFGLQDMYVEDGLDFPAAVKAFQADYGEGARRLDRAFAIAWQMSQGGERPSVADVLESAQTTPQADRTGDASAALHLRIFDYLKDLDAAQIPKNPVALRSQVAAALGLPVERLTDDIDALNDAIEAKWALDLRARLADGSTGPSLTEQVEAARTVEGTLPRGHRTLEKSALQQFSTPLPIGVLADAAAQATADDFVVEPTGGTGNLLVAVPSQAEILAVELAPRRADLLRESGYNVAQSDYLAYPFTDTHRPTVIVTNPPWGKYSTGKYGRGVALGFAPNDVAERFVGKNLRDLADGGRLVAVMPTTMLESTSFKKWLKNGYTVRAIIKSPPGSYDTRATTIDSVLLVVDKIGASGTLPAVIDATDWGAYIAAVEAIHARSEAAPGRAPNAPRPDSGSRPGGLRGGGPGGRAPKSRRDAPVGTERPPELVAGDTPEGGRGPLVPDGASDGPAPQPEGTRPDIAAPSSDVRAAAAASGYFAPYTRRSALRGQPHPKLLVEARQLAGVPYPALTVTPTPSMQRAIDAGRVSVEQAEQALAVLQANSGEKPFGYLAADAVGVGKSREIAMTILGAMDRAKAAGRPLRLMLTTKSRDNVEDLLDEIHYVASGQTAAQGGAVPFEIYRLADDYPGAKKVGNDYEPLPKTIPHAVYVVDSFNVSGYRQALVDVDLHGIVGDEVQRFTNAEAAIGASWVNLHARIMRGTPRDEQFFAYFTATPAQKVEDYAYLYGLRLWPIDGFNEWLELVTGSLNEDQARKLAEDTERGTVADIDTLIQQTGADPVGGDADGHQGAQRPGRAWGVGGSSVFAQRLTPAEGEQIPREWKMLGRFSARDLWRAGTTFEIHEFAMTPAQTKIYNQFADLAVDIVTMAQKYGLYDKSGRSSRFGVTGMLQFAAKRIQMQPALEEALRLAKKFHAEGYQPVLSIINVSEMSAERGHLLASIEKINTRMVDTDPDDPDGGLVDMGEIPEAVVDRARLLDRVRDLGSFSDPVEMIADALGQDKVAFIIGKEKAGRRKASAEFQSGKRPFAVISGAGSTGINLDQRIRTDVGPGHGKRVFLDVQYEWSAMEGLQRYGRVDRASSIQSPRLVAITSGNAAEKKFLATIANRMAALGALSKGGAESTGAAGNALAEFEITGDDALAAARRAYEESDEPTRRSFATIKSSFRDPNRNGSAPDRADFDPYKPKRDAHGVSMQDFQLPLLLMPTEQANAFWTQFIKYRDELRAESGEQALMRSTRFKGEILATAHLKDNLALYTVRNAEGRRFGILVGLITPEMPRLRTLMAGAQHADTETETTSEGWQSQSNTADLRSRRRYVTFTTADTILAGLQIPFTRIPSISESYGVSALRPELKTAAQVLAYLKAGETINLAVTNPDNDKPWQLRLRRTDERIVIDHARMADRTMLTAHGASYSPVGNYWHVTDLETFLERWPVPEQATTPRADSRPAGPSGNASMGGYADTLGPGTPSGIPTGFSKLHPIEFPELVELARELSNTPSVVKAFRKEGKMGEFAPGRPGRSAIRLHADLFKKGNEIQLAATLAHELGHLADWLPDYTLKRGNILGRLQTLRSFLRHQYDASDGTTVKLGEVRDELLALSKLWRPWDPEEHSDSYNAYRKSGKELYADAVSVLLNNPGLLEERAPTFFKEFFAEIDKKPDVRQAYEDLQLLLSGDREDLIARRRSHVQADVLMGQQTALEAHRMKQAAHEAGEGNYFYRMRTALYDKNTPINDFVMDAKARGVVVPEDEDPRYFLQERNYVGGKMKAAGEEYVQPIRDALREADVPWMALHEELMYQRIIAGDRSEYANPRGLSPESARDSLAALHAGLSVSQGHILQQAARDLRAWVKRVVREAHAVGLLTDAMWASIEENPAYAPFRVVEHIEDEISWRIYKQIGTLKGIGHTGDAAILKAMATIRAIERQKMLVAAFDFMESHAPAGSIAQAEERWNGKGMAPVEPLKDAGTVMVSYYDHGKRRGKLVDPYVANSLNNHSVGQDWMIVRALSAMNSRYFRPVFTTLNLGFQTANFFRDLARAWVNHPDRTFGEMLASPFVIAKGYGRGVKLARARAFAAPTSRPAKPWSASRLQGHDDLVAAEKAGILGLTWNDLMRGKDVADTEIEQILGKLGVGPGAPKPGHPLLAPARGLIQFISDLGDFIETLPKAAALYEYAGDGSIADISPAQRSYIREKVGSPDFRKGGTHTPMSNNLFLFSNAFLQGTGSDADVAGLTNLAALKRGRLRGLNGPGPRGPGGAGYGPQPPVGAPKKSSTPPGPGSLEPNTAFGFWWKTALLSIAPALATFAAMYLQGDDKEGWRATLRRNLMAVSEYDLTNYIVIPLGFDANGNVRYLRLPQSDTGRLIHGLVWKTLQFARGDKDAMAASAAVLDYMGGQTPSLSPQVGLLTDTAQFATGGKVYDQFRDRFLYTEDEAADPNRWRKAKKFIGYEFQQMGGGIVWKFYPGTQTPQTRSIGQVIIEAPILSNIIGRYVKITNYGEIERLRAVKTQTANSEAGVRLDIRSEINDAVNRYQQLPNAQQTLWTQRAMARAIVEQVYSDPKIRSTKLKAMEQRLALAVVRGSADAMTEAVMEASSNAQKAAIIKTGRDSMSTVDFNRWKTEALQQHVISPAVIIELSKSTVH